MPTSPTVVMRPSLKKCLLFLGGLLFILSIVAPHVSSYDCFSPSPSFSGDKTPYDDINVRELTRSEQKMLSTLFKPLKGRWQGDAEEVQCTGSGDAPTVQRFILSIDAEGKTDRRGGLTLRVKLRSKTQKTNWVQTFAFDITDNKLQFDHGDVELIEVSQSRVRFLFRRAGGSTGSGGGGAFKQNLETFITLIAEKNAFSIERRVYKTGKFAFGRLLHFTR